MSSDRTVGVDAVGVVIVPPCLCTDLHRCFVAVVGASAVGVFDGALALSWTDATALHANLPCRTSNVTLRRIDARLACRTGAAACQKRREWGPIAGGDLGPFAYLEFSKSLSSGVLRKHRLRAALLFLH